MFKYKIDESKLEVLRSGTKQDVPAAGSEQDINMPNLEALVQL